MERLRREWTYLTRFGSTWSSVYRWMFSYDPVTHWR
jgi:hypothetical protein